MGGEARESGVKDVQGVKVGGPGNEGLWGEGGQRREGKTSTKGKKSPTPNVRVKLIMTFPRPFHELLTASSSSATFTLVLRRALTPDKRMAEAHANTPKEMR